MTIPFRIPMFSLALVLTFMLGCNKKEAAPKKDAEAQEAHSGEAETNRIPLKQVSGLRTLEVPEPKTEGTWYPAEAIGDESAQAILSSPVKGIVSAIHVLPGRHVGAGTVLVAIQSPELARLKADWLSAKAKQEQAESELQREQRLFDAQADSRRELETARSEAATARADEEATRLALDARGGSPGAAGATFNLRAPRGGSVTTYKIQLGQGVEAGQELGCFQMAFASLAYLELPGPAPEGWRPGSLVEVRKAGDRHWKARLEGTPAALTTDTKRLSYRLRLMGGMLPLPGTPLEVQVPLAKAILLPQSALQQVDGQWGVFVKEGETAEFRPVRRGADLDGKVMVFEGVKPGESIVSEDAYLLKSLVIKRKSGGDDHD